MPIGGTHRDRRVALFERFGGPEVGAFVGGEDDPIHPIESQADIATALPAHLVQFERFANCWHAVIPDTPRTRHGGDPGLHRASFVREQTPKTKPAPEGAGGN
jgi:proline iminopeptidase